MSGSGTPLWNEKHGTDIQLIHRIIIIKNTILMKNIHSKSVPLFL
jgi:hypothetical protein